MYQIGRVGLGLIIAFLTLTCARITVNVYFPAAELEDAATQIEQEVRGDGLDGSAIDTPPRPKPSGEAPASKPQSQLIPLWRQVSLQIGPAIATAQGINVNIKTPAIRRLIASRKKRYASLQPLLAKCVLGESNQGLVELRKQKGLSLKDKAKAKSLRAQENQDRQQLYQALATANNLPANKVREVAVIFANVNRRDARSGWCVQDTSGNWKTK